MRDFDSVNFAICRKEKNKARDQALIFRGLLMGLLQKKNKFLFQALVPAGIAIVCMTAVLGFQHWQMQQFADLKGQFDSSQRLMLRYSILRQSSEILSEQLSNRQADPKQISEGVDRLVVFSQEVGEKMHDANWARIKADVEKISQMARPERIADSRGRAAAIEQAKKLQDQLAEGFANATIEVDAANAATYRHIADFSNRIEYGLIFLFFAFVSMMFSFFRAFRGRIKNVTANLGSVDLTQPATFAKFTVGPEDKLQMVELAYREVLGRLEGSLEETNRERARSVQASKLASLGEMSAGVAHEVNNTLGIIAANLPLLTKFRENPEKFSAKISQMEKATFRIEKIVKGLKKFSRSSAIAPEHKLESLSEIVEEVITLTAAKSRRHGVPVEAALLSDLHILCDGVEIEQVLVNLINNAIDAVKKNGEKWVKINALREGAEIVVQVVDSGVGITPEVEQKLFQPFYTTKPVGEGTGLGLSIAKGILDQHHAKISINRSFQTTCFEIRFPAQEAMAHAA
jgi:C4-dicarboxylate-specific signal transduction histidine kinase